MPVDVEAITASFLRAQPEIAALVDSRVYTDLPNATDRIYPLLLLVREGSSFSARGYLEAVTLRLECYGNDHAQANELANVALAVLEYRIGGRYPRGSITGAAAASLIYEPDEDVTDADGHARPRYVGQITIYAHP